MLDTLFIAVATAFTAMLIYDFTAGIVELWMKHKVTNPKETAPMPEIPSHPRLVYGSLLDEPNVPAPRLEPPLPLITGAQEMNLEVMTIRQLKSLAAKRKLPKYSNMRKPN